MKIVYLSPSFLPSKEANSIHVMKMCQAFALHGHKVILTASPFGESLSTQELTRYYGVENTFEIKLITRVSFPGKNILYGVFSALYAWRRKPDIVYGRDVWGCFFSTLFGMKTILEMHQPYRSYNRLYKVMLSVSILNKNCIRVVVISQGLQRMYANDVPHSKGKLLIAHDCADKLPLNGKMTLNANNTEVIHVGYCGSLYKGRGIDIIIGLAQRIPEYEFHVAGGSIQEVEFWKKNADEKKIKNVHFYGFLLPGITHTFRNACDILLAPYQLGMHISGGAGADDIHEFFSPLKLFEYMSSGKPIVISNLPVISEVLSNNVNGIFVEADNLDDWEKALRSLKDAKRRSLLGENAYSEFCLNYTWDYRAKRVLEGYVQ